MSTSSRFAVAVHILSGLTMHEGEPLASDVVAKSASTNPAVIRRLVSMLNEAGFSRSVLGQGGGAVLAKPAKEITLLDVFRAVETEDLFALHRETPDQECVVGRYIQPTLQRTLDKALSAMAAELNKVTIADVVRDIKKMDKLA
ncbi:MAG: Rrf2 family transcriptional regulator [Aquabacterium sp.]